MESQKTPEMGRKLQNRQPQMTDKNNNNNTPLPIISYNNYKKTCDTLLNAQPNINNYMKKKSNKTITLIRRKTTTSIKKKTN